MTVLMRLIIAKAATKTRAARIRFEFPAWCQGSASGGMDLEPARLGRCQRGPAGSCGVPGEPLVLAHAAARWRLPRADRCSVSAREEHEHVALLGKGRRGDGPTTHGPENFMTFSCLSFPADVK